MINRKKLETTFKQSCDSCVLASYAVVGRYFTDIDIEEFFKAYCDVHHLNGLDTAEKRYKIDFYSKLESYTYGYEIILELHKSSTHKVFNKCRDLFSSELIPDYIAECYRTEKVLKDQEALLNLTYSIKGGGHHSVTIGTDGVATWCMDTVAGMKKFHESFAMKDQFKDAVLYLPV